MDEKGHDKMSTQLLCHFNIQSAQSIIHCLGLPKALQEALQFLASHEEISLIMMTLQEQLIQADPNAAFNPQPVPEFNLDLNGP